MTPVEFKDEQGRLLRPVTNSPALIRAQDQLPGKPHPSPGRRVRLKPPSIFTPQKISPGIFGDHFSGFPFQIKADPAHTPDVQPPFHFYTTFCVCTQFDLFRLLQESRSILKRFLDIRRTHPHDSPKANRRNDSGELHHICQ